MTTEKKMKEATEKAYQLMMKALTAPALAAKLKAAMPKDLAPPDYMMVCMQAMLSVAAVRIVSAVREAGNDPTGDKKFAKICGDSLKQRIEAEVVE